MALYLGHMAATGRSIASVQQARSAISHFHAAAGVRERATIPARHPVVAEAIKGLAQPGPGTQAGRRPDLLMHPGPGPRGPPPAQARPRRHGWNQRRPPTKRAALDLAIIGVLADGGLRRSEAAALTWGDVELWADGTGRHHGPEGQEPGRAGNGGS